MRPVDDVIPWTICPRTIYPYRGGTLCRDGSEMSRPKGRHTGILHVVHVYGWVSEASVSPGGPSEKPKLLRVSDRFIHRL
jgi:hypothetical protein